MTMSSKREAPRCMICGKETADGRHICLTCEGTDDMQTFRVRPRTNGDRIRQMTDSELAAFLVQVAGVASGGFRDGKAVRRWLGGEVKT